MRSGWNGRKVLVTGGGGFIGSHLVEELVAAGARVTAMVHYNGRTDPGHLRLLDPGLLSRVEVVAGDVRDPFFVRGTVAGKSVIFHLAALIGIPYSYAASHSYVETNVVGTLNVLEACRAERVDRAVHTSTSEVYGTARYAPMDEDHPLHAQSPYAATKVAADKLAESFHLSFGLPVATIRPFNTFGPRQSARAVIPAILSQIAAGQEVISLGAVDPVRDFTFVKDTARGFLAVAESSATVGEVTNVGSGEGVTIGELVDVCARVANRSVTVAAAAERLRPQHSEVRRLVCDNRKARRLANWTPEYTLADGLRETLRFVEAHPALYDVRRYAV